MKITPKKLAQEIFWFEKNQSGSSLDQIEQLIDLIGSRIAAELSASDQAESPTQDCLWRIAEKYCQEWRKGLKK